MKSIESTATVVVVDDDGSGSRRQRTRDADDISWMGEIKGRDEQGQGRVNNITKQPRLSLASRLSVLRRHIECDEAQRWDDKQRVLGQFRLFPTRRHGAHPKPRVPRCPCARRPTRGDLPRFGPHGLVRLALQLCEELSGHSRPLAPAVATQTVDRLASCGQLPLPTTWYLRARPRRFL